MVPRIAGKSPASLSPLSRPEWKVCCVPVVAVATVCAAAFFSGCEKSPSPAAPGTGGPPSKTAPGSEEASSGARPGSSRASGVIYEDRAEASGIRFLHTDGSSGKYYIVETLASGVGLFDYNGDGLLDIYFPNGRMLPPGAKPAGTVLGSTPTNVLYRQNPDGSFTDATREAGVAGTAFGVGCCMGDYDGDGHLDLYVTEFGPNVLYRNNGDGTFTDVTARAGVGDDRFGAGAAFFDYDLDGDLDLYVSNYCGIDFEKTVPCYNNNVPGYCPPNHYPAVPDVLYRNNGDGTFTDVSRASGILEPAPGRGMGVVATDLDGDGRPDIYVANDGSENFLFKNLGNGKFEEIALGSGVAFDVNGDEQGSMGVDIADYDLDGRFDIVVTNYQKQTNALYRMDETGYFTDVALESRMAANSLPLVAWGTKFFDYDNDGLPDLFIANGHLEDRIGEYDQSSTYKQQNQLLKNFGNGKFLDVSDTSGQGLMAVKSSRGAAFGDIDNDGDIDIVVSNSREGPDLLINQGGHRGNWIGLQLAGKKDRFAIGARGVVFAGGRRQINEVRSGGSYISQNDLRLHFGLGSLAKVDRVEIIWPDRSKDVLTDPPINRYISVLQGKGILSAKSENAGTPKNHWVAVRALGTVSNRSLASGPPCPDEVEAPASAQRESLGLSSCERR